MSTITIAVDLRPALAVAAARQKLEAAQAEWGQAHLIDAESEDARQRCLDAAEALAEAEAALAAAPAPAAPAPLPTVVAEADQRAEQAGQAVNAAQEWHRAAADAYLRHFYKHDVGSRGVARARRRMLLASDLIDKAWDRYRKAMAEKVRVRRALGLYVSPRDEAAAAGACV